MPRRFWDRRTRGKSEREAGACGEALEPRRLFATLGGTVYVDADTSFTRGTREAALKNRTVYLDANANGRPDRGETTALTDKNGRYAFKKVAAGTHLVGVVADAGYGQTTPGRLGADRGSFDITLNFKTSVTPEQSRAFATAAARWESVITRDLPDVGSIDDVRIDVTITDIDGPGGTLGQSNPLDTRDLFPGRYGSDLPYTGEMEFDTDDVGDLIDAGGFADTITHEMAHVLGFGTIWSDGDLGLITGEGGRDPQFTGRNAAREYNALFDENADSVPVESRGGDGTADSHWPERLFTTELMTGYAEDSGSAEPLSRVTVGQFEDLGYAVNYSAADAWNPLRGTATLTTPLDLGARAFGRRVTVAKNDSVTTLDFGYRADAPPRVGRVTVTSGALGGNVTLTASRITDADGDDVPSVAFYAESNGVAGLQGGRGGDTALGTSTGTNGVRAASAAGVFTLSAATTGLTVGALANGATATYYAVATDALGLSGRRSTTGTLSVPPPPTRPNPVTTARQSPTRVTLRWRDRSTGELGFRIELSTDSGFTAIVRAFNVPAGTASTVLDDLVRNGTYYARVRAYGYGGASAYTRSGGFHA